MTTVALASLFNCINVKYCYCMKHVSCMWPTKANNLGIVADLRSWYTVLVKNPPICWLGLEIVHETLWRKILQFYSCESFIQLFFSRRAGNKHKQTKHNHTKHTHTHKIFKNCLLYNVHLRFLIIADGYRIDISTQCKKGVLERLYCNIFAKVINILTHETHILYNGVLFSSRGRS
jgi:hypothetical protein